MAQDIAGSASVRWRFDPGPEFTALATRGTTLVLRREIAPHASALLARLREIRSSKAPGAGGRSSLHVVPLPGAPDVAARRALRGGWMRLIASDLFLGARPRPLVELAVAVEACRRGIAVAEPLGAIVERASVAFYRGWLLTRPLAGMTLWEFVQTDEDPAVREHVLFAARESIAAMHARGLFHADLNLHNLFVTREGERFAVVILDLDKARLYDEAVAPRLRARNAARLRRSIRKLDPDGRYFNARAVEVLTGS